MYMELTVKKKEKKKLTQPNAHNKFLSYEQLCKCDFFKFYLKTSYYNSERNKVVDKLNNIGVEFEIDRNLFWPTKN